MKVVVVANDGEGDDGFVGERLADYGAIFDRRWRESPISLDGAEVNADVIVLLGSDWSVYHRFVAENVAAEQDLITRAIARGVPLLGICFGAQIIAAALGCDVVRATTPEIGWRELSSPTAPFLSGQWFQYHADRWIDRGLVRSVVENAIAPQAFEVGRVLAVQFHPEVTAATASRWLRAAPDEVQASGETVERIERETELVIANARDRCHLLVDHFITDIATRALPALPSPS